MRNAFDFAEYMELAQRTASRESDPRGDIGATLATLEVLVAAGGLADLLKRQIFYRREATFEMFASCIENIREAISLLEGSISVSVNQNDPLPFNAKLLHGTVGTISEEAEMLSSMLDVASDGRKIDEVNLIEEAGDALWYQAEKLAGVEQISGVGIAGVCAANIAKLAVRHGDKFNGQSAIERDLISERAAVRGRS